MKKSTDFSLVALLLVMLFFPMRVNAMALRGDVNGDSEVSIGDVSEVINYLMRGYWSDGQSGALINLRGDVTFDGEVAINDVAELVNYLLRGTWTDEQSVSTRSFNVNGVEFTMVRVEGGSFMMGATDEQDADAWEWEKPAHQVTLSSYCIAQTEVTQALWQAVMGYNPSFFVGNSLLPVEKVSWNDCQLFITRLNDLTGQHFRLPTEAEWEFAARGGRLTHGWKYAGGDDIDAVAWYVDNAEDATHPVATMGANELGLYDMSGNVWEWCQDVYGTYSDAPQVNPTGTTVGSYRVYRGGGWNGSARSCRVTYRFDRSPTATYNNQGFRLAL